MSKTTLQKKLPIILVTGFLGSGKTSFLRNLAERHPQKRLLFLVNEFSETGVDDATLAITGRPTQSVVGGSLFCECKAGEFVKLMRTRVLSEHETNGLHAVIIETSGIADPEAIGVLMDNHGLSEYYEVQQVVAIAAPQKLPTLLENLPSIRAQIQTSQVVLLNKIDLATSEEIETATVLIAECNPQAKVAQTTYGDFDLAFESVAPELPHEELSTCDANPFSTETVVFDAPIPKQVLVKWLDDIPSSILRIKGNIETDTGWFDVQRTVDSKQISEIDNQNESSLVLISHDDDEETLDTIVAELESQYAK
ncbi:CobW family GTP-binding protein [Pelagicoccus mobilis]|uniref:GTP-binding protein n=1 Tax=Pelagicoccus mobilis TaxID=415221 RepID=A0A934RUE8_9BACT|nr:GTP-binding protein [Pelagicoccus mobilis]MBK1875610.1 GTP-binding protein [Pelagicoccus mobilis]